MENNIPLGIRQIEINTIASSFPHLSKKTGDLHRYLMTHEGFLDSSTDVTTALPENSAPQKLSDAIAHAFRLYDNQNSVVMMIVQPVERNIYDQKGIEFALWDKHKIKMVRHTLGDIHDFGSLDKDGQLIVAGNIIAISYYRAGYTPNDYPTEKEWKARLLVEQSLSIKCPNVAYHLLGTKKNTTNLL